MLKEVLILIVMSNETSFIIKTAVGIVGGLLISAGFLPAETRDAFTTDASTATGYIITIISTIYLLEHALVKVKDDLMYTDEPSSPVTTNVTQVTTTPTETPTSPVNG